MTVKCRILAVVCVLLAASALWSVRHRRRPPDTARMPPPARTLFAPRQRPPAEYNPAREISNAIADVVEKVMPSVVVVRTEKVQYKVRTDPFGFPMYRVRENLAGEGSGVVIDELGHILTSWHVVNGAQWIEVVLNDGVKLPVELIGHDNATDLAILKIKESEPMDLPAVEFGDSDALRVGEMVIAIGSPFSLQSSVTVGHVSQKGRRVQVLPYEDFIQTDAAINEGNSGGPLIDVDGRLVGINAAILTEAQKQGVGIAFAIPSNLAMVVAKSLIETGRHEWPWVGAAFGRGSGVNSRLQVLQVWRDTPAAQAGLLPGDVVVAVNQVPVQSEYDVYRVIFNHSVGETVRFVIEREKQKQLALEMQLEEFPGTTL